MRTTTSPRSAYAALAPAAAAACAGVLVGLLIGHGAQAPLAGLLDPGAVVRWGLPVARTVHDLAAALTIGALVLGAVALPEPSRPAALRVAATSGIVWVAAGVVTLVLTYADFAGVSVGSAGFGAQLSEFVQSFDLGRAMVTSLLLAFVVATGAAMARSVNAIGWLAVLSLLAILPLALAGHAAGSSDHEMAVDSLGAHLVGVTVWVGGLAALTLLRPTSRRRLLRCAATVLDPGRLVLRHRRRLRRRQRVAAARRPRRPAHDVRRADPDQGRRPAPARRGRASSSGSGSSAGSSATPGRGRCSPGWRRGSSS